MHHLRVLFQKIFCLAIILKYLTFWWSENVPFTSAISKNFLGAIILKYLAFWCPENVPLKSAISKNFLGAIIFRYLAFWWPENAPLKSPISKHFLGGCGTPDPPLFANNRPPFHIALVAPLIGTPIKCSRILIKPNYDLTSLCLGCKYININIYANIYIYIYVCIV